MSISLIKDLFSFDKLSQLENRRRRFNLLRNFSIVSLGGFALSIGLLSTVYRQQSVNDLISSTEESNITLTKVFANTIWPEYGSFLSNTQAFSDDTLAADPRTRQLNEAMATQLEESPVAKVKVFDLEGRTVFSTDLVQIGADKSESSGFLSAKSGQVISQLGHRDTFKAVQGDLEDRHMLSSYIPIQSGTDDKAIVGVFELYTDVTPLLQRIEQTQQRIVLSSFLVLGALYLILFLFVRGADRLLKQQYQQVQESEERYRLQSIELEDRVAARTQKLSETLNQLQATQSQLIHQEKMSGLGQMVAGIAHEINNPVNFIHGNLRHIEAYTHDLINFLNLYEQTYLEPTVEIEQCREELDIDFIKEDMEKMLSSMNIGTERIREIVLSLRNFSRKDEAEYKAVNIHEGLESTLLILGHRLKGQSTREAISIIRDFDDVPLIECYAGQLNQVFMNILANAIDAIDAKSSQASPDKEAPRITIRTERRANGVVISIADNGSGMPSDVRERIFEPFFTTKSVGKGTGIGMAISHQLIAEKHQGKLTCFSDPGVGTEFAIEIPISLKLTDEDITSDGFVARIS